MKKPQSLQDKTKFQLIFLVVCFSIHAFGEDSRLMFTGWLKEKNEKTVQDITQKSASAYRQKYGFLSSIYKGFGSSDLKPEYLELIDSEFKNEFGISITELIDRSNVDMKRGLGLDISRFSDDKRASWSEPFKTYLELNWDVARNKSQVSVINSNKIQWETKSSQIANGESMGGNAGSNAVAVNFLCDKEGRIVFIGNFQNAPAHIQTLYHTKRLLDGTVIHSGAGPSWHLFNSRALSPKAMETLKQSLTQAMDKQPENDLAAFRVACEREFRALIGK